MLAYVAGKFKSFPHLVGYELINGKRKTDLLFGCRFVGHRSFTELCAEPWMGDIYKDPKVLFETGYSDKTYLQVHRPRRHRHSQWLFD